MLNMETFEWAELGRTDNLLPVGHQLNKPELLFEKIEDATIEAQVQKLLDTKKANEEANYKANPIRPNIEFDDFTKLDIRVGTILECQKVPKADKLLQFKLMTDWRTRTIVSGYCQALSTGRTGRQTGLLHRQPCSAQTERYRQRRHDSKCRKQRRQSGSYSYAGT